MKIVFAGTPEYAVPSLKALAGLAPKHEVLAVVTQPDRPKGRSAQPSPPPVKSAALALGLQPERIFQPPSINRPDVLAALRALAPDLLCVVAYGGLLKKEALALAKLYPINAHGSLLPKYRGAAPIQAALLEGEAETGISIMRIEERLDSGPVMLQREIPIAPEETAGTLHDKLAALSAVCFLDALKLIDSGRPVFAPQDESQVSWAPKLEKNSGTLDWNREAAYVERFIRAMTPWPGAWTTLHAPGGSEQRRLRLVSVRLDRAESGPRSAVPGSFLAGGPGEARLTITCGDGQALAVTTVQPAGARAMKVDEFLRGAGRAFATGGRAGG